MSILTDLYKRKKPLYCDQCTTKKKSVIGFLSHRAVCQKTAAEKQAMKVQCERCDRLVMPVSMSMHMKYCHSEKLEDLDKEDPTISENNIISNSRRKAAEK